MADINLQLPNQTSRSFHISQSLDEARVPCINIANIMGLASKRQPDHQQGTFVLKALRDAKPRLSV